MRIYLLRHGDAEDQAASGRDFDRRLTPEGIERMRAEAKGMQALDLTFEAIFTSPLLRAKETAEIVAETLKLDAPILDERIGGGFRLSVVQAILAKQGRGEKFLFAGHQPDMSLTIQQLCGGQAEMKRGSLACLECARPEPGQGVLLWLLTPRQLITLSKTR
jgi:phosphohistidine phosphatase